MSVTLVLIVSALITVGLFACGTIYDACRGQCIESEDMPLIALGFVFLMAITTTVISTVNLGCEFLMSPPKGHVYSVRLDNVYNIEKFRGGNSVVFDTSRTCYDQEEGFEFEWVEGKANDIGVLRGDYKKIRNDFILQNRTGKPHIVTFRNKKLLSFYPVE